MHTNIDEIKKYIYINNNITFNFDMSDIEFNILKMDCSKNIILFVKQLKKYNIMNEYINHIEQQINMNINNLLLNYNIVHNSDIMTPVASVIPIIPVASVTPFAPIKTYFSDLIQITILNTYNTSNDNWICPYQYNDLVNNLNNIKASLTLELSQLEAVASITRDFLSIYQKVNNYRSLINNIMIIL